MNCCAPLRRLIASSILFALLWPLVEPASAASWESSFANGLLEWGEPRPWGKENLSFVRDDDVQGKLLRVAIHKGGIDPATMKARGLPLSGSGFKAKILKPGSERAILSYRVRFPEGFDFVRGGKLPGLYGGTGNSGGVIPDGADGFSFRLMWLKNGKGRIYAYVPTSRVFGTPLLDGQFQFTPGKWHRITQEVALNGIGKSDGTVRLWLDDKFVGEVSGLSMRVVDELKIDGIFFDVFFGGNDDTWASSAATFIDFAEFKVRW